VRASGPAVLLLLGALLVGLLAACTGTDETPPPAPAPDRGTPLRDLDTRRLAIAREPFCDAVDEAAVVRALDGEPRRSTSYAPGDRVALATGVKDVAHEFGCVFTGRALAQARAWVFAPPVTRAQARALVADAPREAGCAAVEGAPAFGRPTVAVRCRDADRPSLTTVRFAGLFGDAWLSCSVRAREVAAKNLLDRAGRWCVAVAEAVAAE
jgi:hypothetical protein